ncbi:ABC transporter substrate-binding protein [Chromobacterium sp. IIBBL 290-4]|uniref:substrate-binding periplasmic protein n=1 Tax=Chromobacterium sp. IIBBL 290-4 TaxID=2953890 RepID=UPI0020B88914|nr:transporter substrate-binding domain-containing protein [Chromobacterium sp. IIBBL 290-4]UTH74603.1 transporter substrate-binding domain-containing protein [Chromobacterium sp. IIBBL 290-4]
MLTRFYIACACWILPAAAADELRAYTEEVPPLNYSENGKVKGFATDVLRMAAKDAGIRLRVESLPWLRALAIVKDTPNTLLYTTVRTPERESQFQWVGPISPRKIYLYRLRDNTEVEVAGLLDLARYRIGAMSGSAAANQLADLGFQAGGNLDLSRDDATNLKKLLLHRVELVAMLDWAMSWQLRQLHQPEQTVVPALLLDGKKQYWYALNRATPPELAKRLQASLDKIQADGRLQSLRLNYRND